MLRERVQQIAHDSPNLAPQRQRREGVGTLTFFLPSRTDRVDQMLSRGESFSFAVRTAAGKSKTPVARSRFRRGFGGSGSRLRDGRPRPRATSAAPPPRRPSPRPPPQRLDPHIPIRQKDLSDASFICSALRGPTDGGSKCCREQKSTSVCVCTLSLSLFLPDLSLGREPRGLLCIELRASIARVIQGGTTD